MSGWRAWHKVAGPRQGDNPALWHSSSYDSHDSFREAHRHQIGIRISLKLDLRTCRLLRREGMLHIPLYFLDFLDASRLSLRNPSIGRMLREILVNLSFKACLSGYRTESSLI
jgi:hypothetical protein